MELALGINIRAIIALVLLFEGGVGYTLVLPKKYL
jgi:hypothetical protein